MRVAQKELVHSGRFQDRDFRGLTREDISWVVTNLYVEEIKPENAPSAAVWSVLCWARSDSKGFMNKYVAQAMKDNEKAADEVDESSFTLADMIDRVAGVAKDCVLRSASELELRRFEDEGLAVGVGVKE